MYSTLGLAVGPGDEPPVPEEVTAEPRRQSLRRSIVQARAVEQHESHRAENRWYEAWVSVEQALGPGPGPGGRRTRCCAAAKSSDSAVGDAMWIAGARRVAVAPTRPVAEAMCGPLVRLGILCRRPKKSDPNAAEHRLEEGRRDGAPLLRSLYFAILATGSYRWTSTGAATLGLRAS